MCLIVNNDLIKTCISCLEALCGWWCGWGFDIWVWGTLFCCCWCCFCWWCRGWDAGGRGALLGLGGWPWSGAMAGGGFDVWVWGTVFCCCWCCFCCCWATVIFWALRPADTNSCCCCTCCCCWPCCCWSRPPWFMMAVAWTPPPLLARCCPCWDTRGLMYWCPDAWGDKQSNMEITVPVTNLWKYNQI